MRALALLVALALGWPLPAAACMFATDCAVGSRCIKPRGALAGVCVGGLEPGHPPGSRAGADRLEFDETHGEGCRFDLDCGIGLRCVKGPRALRGVCMSASFEQRLWREAEADRFERYERRRSCHSRWECDPDEICLLSRGFGPGRCVKTR